MIYLKRKTLAIIIFMLINVSCNKTQDKKNSQTKGFQNLSINDKNMIVGNWSCCKYGRSTSIINLNQCLMFTFNTDYSGNYKIQSGDKILFKWEILNDSIIDINFDQIRDGVLKNGRYKISRDTLSEGNELKLINISDEMSYFLIATSNEYKK